MNTTTKIVTIGAVVLAIPAVACLPRLLRAYALTKRIARLGEQTQESLELADAEPSDGALPPQVQVGAQCGDGSSLVLNEKGEAVVECAPDAPSNSELRERLSRRARLFASYWVNRVHEEYPRVVGDWDEASLACTRRYLTKIMKEPRLYYVRKRERGQWVYEKKYKRGMTTSQVASCVDWIVTLSHRGTDEQLAQLAARQAEQPNWLMRLLGVRVPGFQRRGA